MIVCSCNVLSDHDVRTACSGAQAPRTPGQVYGCLGCSPQCGRCARTIKAIMDEALVGCGKACPGCPAVHTESHVLVLESVALHVEVHARSHAGHSEPAAVGAAA